MTMIVGSGIFLWSAGLSLLKRESLQKDAMPKILTKCQLLRKIYRRTIITKFFVSGPRVAKTFPTGTAGKYFFEILTVPLTFISRKCTCYNVLIPPLPLDNTFPQPLSDCFFTESTHISFKRIYHAFHHFSPVILQHTNDKLQANDTTTPILFHFVTSSKSLSNFAIVS